MLDQLSSETVQTLQRYVKGELSNADLADWLAGAEYDSELSEGERDELAGIRLVLIEAQEGRREKDEILAVVAEILAPVLPDKKVIAERTDASTSWFGNATLTATPSRVQRAGISL